MTDKRIYQISLTMINGVGDILARHLLESFGEPETIFTEKRSTLEKVPGIGPVLASEIKKPDILRRAEEELAFLEKNQITLHFLTNETYPKRLRECPDAPVLFYYKGNADLDASHIISVVGTRNATDYGRELTQSLISDLASLLPDTLIISGLAYGIDIQAHRLALKHKLPTVAVLAHGLDRIYPPTHRPTAVEILQQGGLLTDFPSRTNPDKPNFIKRNRIVAGLADATVVIESAEKGGSLITADIAFSYGRDVFTYPGRISDASSQGCHTLIRQNKAALITSAADLTAAMCWDTPPVKKKLPVQTQLFFSGNDDYERIVALLHKEKEVHINQLAVTLNLPVYRLSSLLFELEMENVLKSIPGNIYKLV